MKQQLINKLLKQPADNTAVQVFRYLFAGGAAFVIDFLLLYLFTDIFHIHYLLSTILSFLAGLLVTYILSIFWIFNRRRFKSRTSEILIFVLIGVVGLLLTSLFMWLLTSIMGIHYMISKIITTAVVFVWNFAAKKIILFSGTD